MPLRCQGSRGAPLSHPTIPGSGSCSGGGLYTPRRLLFPCPTGPPAGFLVAGRGGGVFLGACSRGALKPLRCTTHAELTLGREAARDSEETGFLLQLVPLPQGQSAELLRGHLKDPLEVLGRQVPLRGGERGCCLEGLRLAQPTAAKPGLSLPAWGRRGGAIPQVAFGPLPGAV